ncbi:FecR domain-containing protein [Methylophaga thalassica]|uniref:FecR domain-containing protein n=1 Tax=Methylophaga thalassica TaxID=40223 RepID=UPI002E7B8D4F|nr:FecR domain-containing protein [Methylophaga thalassica]WVI86756.1 FecR domain-containing protein [Methylophaga thalassica]
MSLNPADIPENVIKEVVMWLVKVQDDDLTTQEQQRLLAWRNENHLHELAWQRAENLGMTLQKIPPDIGKQVLGRPATMDRREFAKHLGLLLTLVPIGGITYKYAPWQAVLADIKTSTGEQRTIQLADGSQLMLNTDSAVDLAFNDTQRLVKLYRGEIYIKTAKDSAQRPFLVQTAQGRLHALGTEFVVRQHADYSYLGVIDSAVDVLPKDDPEQSQIIEKGQQTRFDSTGIEAPSPLDDNANAWINGVIYADNMPLSEFINYLKRYRTGVITCDESCHDIYVSGSFQINDPDHILYVLEKTRPIEIEWRTRFWAKIRKKQR